MAELISRAGLPFFDHGALYSLKYFSKPNEQDLQATPVYGLRLLDASWCLNTTAPGLAEAFKHFHALTYLDLTRTAPARDATVLASLRHMPQLQVLKLRSLHLRDEDVDVLAEAIGCTIRSLDLRDNQLTDQTVRILLEKCFKNPKEAALIQQRMQSSITGDWPSNSGPQIGLDLHPEYLGNRQDDHVRRSLTTGFVSHLGIESVCGTGITHLYISGNGLTVEGISGLIRSKRLLVLDAGTLLTGLVRQPSQSLVNGELKFANMPGAQKLIPILDKYAKDLRYLRIHHAAVTVDAPTEDTDPKMAELEDTSGIVLPPHLVELEAVDQAVHEMPGPEPQELPPDSFPIAELEGSPVPPRPESTQEEAPTPPPAPCSTLEEPRVPEIRRGSAFAPEPIDLVSPILDATGTIIGSLNSPLSPIGTQPLLSPFSQLSFSTPSQTPLASASGPVTPGGTHLDVPKSQDDSHNRKRTYSGVINEHEAHLKFRSFQPHSLLPSMLPNLQTLILTDVPATARSNSVAKHLIQFILDCSEESNWAKLQASVGYELPPGHDRRDAEQRYARSLFALQRLVLEVALEKPDSPIHNRSWRHSGGIGTIPNSKSSVEDPDCEAFWTAARDDFSFFGDEECGQPDGPERRVPLAALMEKMSVVTDSDEGSEGIAPWENGGVWPEGSREAIMARRMAQMKAAIEQGNGMAKEQVKKQDVLAEVSKFRKEKKRAREITVARGDADTFVEGFWEGEIVVIRPKG